MTETTPVEPMTETTEDTDWAGRATATVVGYVDTVRAASTGKALVASRVAVYGLAMALIALVIAVLLLIVLVRLVSSLFALLPGVDDGVVWPTYLLLGVVFLFAGWFLSRKKEK